MTKPSIPDVIDRFVAYHRKPGNGAWGSLHIVLDDGNCGDQSVKACIQFAEEGGDEDGAELARILLTMSKSQRGRLGRKVWQAEQP